MQDDLNTAAALGAIFELVSDLNSAIDAGAIGTGDVAVAKAAFDRFDRVLGVVSLRQAEDAKPPVPVDEIEQAHRGSPRRPPPPRLRRRRPHPPGPRGTRCASGRQRSRHPLETQVGRMNSDVLC